MRKWALLIIISATLLSGCASMSYYSQAVGGHLEVLRATRPIDEILADPAAEPALKKKLVEVKAIRDFATSELGLPDNGSYRSYADVGRPYVVWNVFAAPEFSLEPQKWCEPVVGCAGYRGFFSKRDAEQLAKQLASEGYDTHVGGVPAYSTLGYMSDPVLNTFLRHGSLEVARVIFHELAHQMAFANGDSVFNESFATAVENEGLRRWLTRLGNPEQGSKIESRHRRDRMFIDLVQTYRGKLKEIYAAKVPADDKRRAKAETIADMQRAYHEMQAGWAGEADYAHWFAQTPNNAKLATVSLYTQLVPAFEAMLEQEGRNLRRFYRRVAQLAKLPRAERQALLNKVLPEQTQMAAATARPEPR
jgi:predicted aminopeptidase